MLQWDVGWGKHSTLHTLQESLSMTAYPFLNEVKNFEITPVYQKKKCSVSIFRFVIILGNVPNIFYRGVYHQMNIF